eukprot:9746519-Alexandrium_andersonii.AAC.1
MQARGFMDYTSPQLHMEVNRNGAPYNRTWSLSWTEPRHSLLLYVFFKNYHWEGENDTISYALQLRNA